MNTAIAILTHAIGMIFRDLPSTLRTIAPGAGIIAVAAALLYFAGPGILQFDPTSADPAAAPMLSGGDAMVIFASVLIGFTGFVIMVVTWHRYVLLQGPERDAGIGPSAGIVLSYVWKSILLALLMIPVLFLLGMIMAALVGAGGAVGAMIVQFIATFGIGWLVMRLSLVLPASSIGRKMGFGDSWRATEPGSGVILWLVLGLSVINLAAQLIGLATVSLPAVAFTVQLILSLVTTLIGVSALTTLYGIYVEGRRLDG